MNILMAIITSLVASVVFYLFFQLIPEKIRYRKIRPRIEVELVEIASSLFFYLEEPFRCNMHSASFFQDEMCNGFVNKRDFELGLCNKCLNESYLFDENRDKMMVVGDVLKKHADEVSRKIHQVLLNQHYLTSNEILIIEDVDRLLYTHSYDSNASSRIENYILRPLNPSLSYMCHTFYKLYLLWLELRQVMFKYSYIKKEKRQGREKYFGLKWSYVKFLVANKEYKKAKKEIKKLSCNRNTDFQQQVLRSYCLQINLEKGKLKQAEALLKKILTDFSRDNLVYMRGFLNCIINNEKMMEVCSSLCPTEEIKEWLCTVEREKLQKEAFLNRNQVLKDYYEKKSKQQPRLM